MIMKKVKFRLRKLKLDIICLCILNQCVCMKCFLKQMKRLVFGRFQNHLLVNKVEFLILLNTQLKCEPRYFMLRNFGESRQNLLMSTFLKF